MKYISMTSLKLQCPLVTSFSTNYEKILTSGALIAYHKTCIGVFQLCFQHRKWHTRIPKTNSCFTQPSSKNCDMVLCAIWNKKFNCLTFSQSSIVKCNTNFSGSVLNFWNFQSLGTTSRSFTCDFEWSIN